MSDEEQDKDTTTEPDEQRAETDETDEQRGISRRQLLAVAAGGAAAGILAGAGGSAAVRAGFGHGAGASTDDDEVDLSRTVAFYDQPHPAGIETEPQRYTVFMTFDLADGATVDQLRSLLALWTAAIGQMAQGRPIGPIAPAGNSSTGLDTGEADNLAPASLTVTVGLGPGVFDTRFGLAAKRPPLLTKLPALPGDYLDPAQSDGDLSIQACADDPQVAYHAVRNLARMTETTAHTRWVVMGFGRASAGAHQQTPRNLLGFKDGTRNLKTPAEFKQFVWLRDQGWMTGGTYQVVRKIRMIIENWDSDRISDQENVFGRSKVAGAPLTGTKEFDTPNFKKLGSSGQPVIDPRAHIALAAHENNGGVRILRRSYNYTDGLNSDGLLDAGLLFIAYMDDPQHFIQLQTKLGASDLLNEYIQHIGSGIFAIPPAPRRGGYIGEALFE
jgi:deferrochelatase/peroxidase EfeB